MQKTTEIYSFNDFVKDHNKYYAIKRYPMRHGQFLMNFLFETWPKEYHRIVTTNTTDTKHIDCFYNDNYIENTFNHLEKVWNKYPY